MFQLFNHNCRINYDDEKKAIDGYDIPDLYVNNSKFFTLKKRGLKKGWEQLKKEFGKYTTMGGAIKILNRFNCCCHSYYGRD